MLLHVYCPSRGRPRQAAELLRSFNQTRRTQDARLIFLLDDDDPTSVDYPQVRKVLGPPTGDPTGPLNRAALATLADAVGFCGDDTRFETDGWDELVLTNLEDGPVIVWGDDGHDRPWPSTVFMSASIPKALGYMVPPSLRRGFFDIAWMLLAGGVTNEWGQVVLPPNSIARVLPLMFRHINLPAGHPDGPSAQTIAQDERNFHLWVANELPLAREKVRGLVGAPN